MNSVNYYAIPGIKPMYRNIKAAVVDKDVIINVVCQHFDKSLEKIKNKNRFGEVVLARRMLMFFLFKYTGMSKSEIARMIKRDHTTVVAGLRSFQDRIDTEEPIRETIDVIRQKIVNSY